MFTFDSTHVLLACGGAAIIVAYLVPRFISGREPAASAPLIVLGGCVFAFIPGMPRLASPFDAPELWEKLSELTLIVALFGTGLRFDKLATAARRAPTIRLLVIGMPCTIIAVSLLGMWLGGLTVTAALLLGAVLSPTDPVLAGDVQVGPPMEGGEHPVRFTLTAEAGLNDGLAFPFVYLALAAAAGELSAAEIGTWAARDVVYRIGIGAVAGVAVGWALGKALFELPRSNRLADTASGVVAFAGVLLCYGLTELIEGYGFVAAFVAGLTLRRSEPEHDFHRLLHSFSESIEHTLTAVLLVAIGAVIPALIGYLEWWHLALSASLILVIRPVIGWIALARTSLKRRERAVVAFYGIRGIGSIYYISFAAAHPAHLNQPGLWAVVVLTIVMSTCLHGMSAGAAVAQVDRTPN